MAEGGTPRTPVWTIDSLHEHMVRLFADSELRNRERFEFIADKFALAKEAVTKAEVATEKRFEGVNEFRSQLGDQARTFMPRAESEQVIATIRRDVEELKSRNTELDSRGQGKKDVWGYVVGAIGCLVGIVGILSYLQRG